jgi:hypothetical protein
VKCKLNEMSEFVLRAHITYPLCCVLGDEKERSTLLLLDRAMMTMSEKGSFSKLDIPNMRRSVALMSI